MRIVTFIISLSFLAGAPQIVSAHGYDKKGEIINGATCGPLSTVHPLSSVYLLSVDPMTAELNWPSFSPGPNELRIMIQKFGYSQVIAKSQKVACHFRTTSLYEDGYNFGTIQDWGPSSLKYVDVAIKRVTDRQTVGTGSARICHYRFNDTRAVDGVILQHCGAATSIDTSSGIYRYRLLPPSGFFATIGDIGYYVAISANNESGPMLIDYFRPVWDR